ncbi:MAG: metal-dependent transcriptional regulator, partial [Spirochaetota bacterium]|nr:metal-dependent transcriptional regulator [Spirochaetota bacterium]
MNNEIDIDFYFEGTNLSSNMEDYIEQIATLSKEKKFVRVKDIANGLNKKMPSVTSALNKLMDKGLVYYEKYAYVELTKEGEKLADRVYKRHSFLSDVFTNVLRMNRKKAEENACRIEHFLSP